MTSFATITVAVDGSKNADRALDAAIELSVRFGSSLTILSVVPLPVVYSPAAAPSVAAMADEEPTYAGVLREGKAKAEKSGVKNVSTALLRGPVVSELLGYLDSHPTDLVVVGARGLNAPERLLLGSTSDALVHRLTSPVLVVKSAA